VVTALLSGRARLARRLSRVSPFLLLLMGCGGQQILSAIDGGADGAQIDVAAPPMDAGLDAVSVADGGREACSPVTCVQLGYNCGPVGNGCGGLLDCGECTAPDTCGGGGQRYICGGGGGGGGDASNMSEIPSGGGSSCRAVDYFVMCSIPDASFGSLLCECSRDAGFPTDLNGCAFLEAGPYPGYNFCCPGFGL